VKLKYKYPIKCIGRVSEITLIMYVQSHKTGNPNNLTGYPKSAMVTYAWGILTLALIHYVI